MLLKTGCMQIHPLGVLWIEVTRFYLLFYLLFFIPMCYMNIFLSFWGGFCVFCLKANNDLSFVYIYIYIYIYK